MITDVLLNKQVINQNEDSTIESYKIDDKVIEGFLKYESQTQDNVNKYILYDYTEQMNNKDFPYEKLYEIISKRQIDFDVIFVHFNSWKHERRVKTDLLNSSLPAATKRNIRTIFNTIKPVYEISRDSIILETEQDGINYLEMKTKFHKEELEACIYNISMNQLRKLYNATGESLFDLNIRVGIQNIKSGKELREVFKNYLYSGIIQNIDIDKYTDKIREYINITEEEIKNYNPEKFWYSHNGINIFVEKDDEQSSDFIGDSIEINPNKISVINGAQTMTNIFLASEEIMENFLKMIDTWFVEDDTSVIQDALEKSLEKTLDTINVKTVFIFGDKKFAKGITKGLNTQIPINEVDFIAVSDTVESINTILGSYQMKILKTGEVESYGKGFTPLEFAKSYLIYMEEPGNSKNLSRVKIEETIDEALKQARLGEDFVKGLEVILEADLWWRKTKNRDILLESINLTPKQVKRVDYISRYGKNYFQSFVIHLLKQENKLAFYVEEELSKFWVLFVKLLSKHDIDVNSFKSDVIYEKLIESWDSKSPVTSTEIIETLPDLVVYINENKENNYSMNSIITKFNTENNIDISNFRTISMYNGNIKEHFPFPNSSFNEIYQISDYPENLKYKTYQNSLFREILEKEFPVYVLLWKDGDLIDKAIYIDTFSFSDLPEYDKHAEEVYNKTIKAFENGKESDLPKSSISSGNKYFHVRPKAKNAKDTFEFTDGSLITKRTFWASKEAVKELININGNM